MKANYDILDHYSHNFYPSELPPQRNISLEQLIKSEQNTILPAHYFYVFYDHEHSKLLYVSPNVEALYGISQRTICDGNEHLLLDIALEEEKPAIVKFIKKIWDEHYLLGKKYVSDRVFTAEYRVKTLTGYILHIMHQNEVITYTKEELPKVVIERFVDMSWLFGEEKERLVKWYVYNRKTNEVEHYFEEKVFEKPAIQLTPREKEMQGLINRGFTSNQIAKKLDISIETVKTHRKNIKAKQTDARYRC